MTGLYFSGTGNSKYAVETFLQEYTPGETAYSIEDEQAVEVIKGQEELVFGYPVQYSSVPKMLRDFVEQNSELWQGKKIFIIATMGLFSGDGAGVLARLLRRHGAKIIGGLYLKMPDSIADEKVLKRSPEENKTLVESARWKIKNAVSEVKKGNPPQEGLGFLSRLAGFFGQRLYFGYKTRNYTDKLKIDGDKCVGCGKCVRLCPMENISLNNGLLQAGDQCTMCYRCVNYCPKQAITLLGKQVVEQSKIEKYIK